MQHFDLASVAIGLTDGIAILRGGRMKSYFVERKLDGQYRMAER